MDSFQGCFKDGTEPGTHDCRWFAAIFFLSRLVLMLFYALILSAAIDPIASMFIALLVMSILVIQPYKESMSHHSYVNTMFLLLFTLWSTSVSGLHIVDVRLPQFSYHLLGIIVVLAFVASPLHFYCLSSLGVQPQEVWCGVTLKTVSQRHR